MNANFAAFLYLVSGVLFIMALRGLSHPTTSRKGNTYGMVGMGIAIVTTLFLAQPSIGGFLLIVLGLAAGGGAAPICKAHPDDGDAAARGRLSLARVSLPFWVRPPHSMPRPPSVSVRSARSTPGAGRNGARRGDRRRHVHGLGSSPS